MDEAQFITLVEEILEVDAGTVAMADSLEDAGWDSLANISFIAEIDQKVNITLDAQRLAKVDTAHELYSLVQETLGASK